MGDASEPIQAELPWLYELSLALGRSLDLGATCRGFLRALVTRPGLTGAAIWWSAAEGEAAEGEAAEGLALLDAWPRCEAPPAVIPLTHPIWRLSRGGEPRVLSPGEVEPGALGWDADRETAAIALHPLGADGVLLLRSSALDLFAPSMLARLGALVGNLALAIRGGLVQARLASSEAALREGEHHFRTLADAGTVLIGTSGVDRGCNYVNPRKEAELALAESEIRLRHTLENTPNVAVQWYDLRGRVLYWNPASERLYGWSAEEALGKTLDRLFFSAEEAAAFGMLLRRLAQSGDVSGPAEYRTRDRQGHPRIVMGTTFPIPSDNQKDQILVCMDVDITDRKAAEDSLRLAASVFSHAREGIMITAPNGDILDVNEAFTRITCYSREEVLGRNPRILSSGRQDRAFYAAMWGDLIDKGHWYGEIWNRRKTGDEYVAMLTVSAVHNGRGEILRYVALFSDITQSKEHERQLLHIAHYDALTGLPNRVLLGDRLQQAMRRALSDGTRLAVAYLDLDGFKAVNDDYGHQIGDELLTALAERMKLSLREEDTIARLGGDEFVVVAPDLPHSPEAPPDVSLPLLSRLLGSVSEPVPVSGRVLQVSASLGVTFYPQGDEVDADQLLRQADQAMYQAKLSGKNRCHVFDNALDRLVRGQHEGLERIRLAMAREEFELVYQPRVNLRTGQVVGAEALIRWRHPERGLLAPEVFLPVLEGHSQSILLGEWVLDTALSQIEAWKAAGLGLSVSVNVDALQLQQPDFVSRLRVQLAAHPGVAAGDLELEVRETSALGDIAQASRVMLACRDLGIDFALDDFGAGYSSLTYLRRLPARQLKIDQSFVRGMLDDPEDLAILEGILGLAGAFHRRAIAEGVESVAHGEMLLRLGCELAQGYGIAQPMPAEAVPGWLARWRPAPSWRNLPPLSRDDRPILFAAVEHRAWISALTDYLRGQLEAPPLELERCRLADWLDREGQARYGGQVAFQAVVRLHREICAGASALLTQKGQGRGPVALVGLDELHRLRDTFLERVLALLRTEGPGQA